MNDDDIPVLSDVVSRKSAEGISQEQIDEICDSLTADARVLIDRIVAEALQEAEDLLRLRVNDRLGDELPELVRKALKDKLGD